jgi:CBS domain-containing protein
MRCEEVMKKDVQCVSPQDMVQAAARRMRDENVGFLPVCDRSRKVLGVVTDRDLAIRILAEGKSASTRVEEVMSREVVACHPEDDLRRAEELMMTNHVSRMICVDGDGRRVGVISLSDIAQQEDAGHAARTMRGVSEREATA